jgi:hypothetical protein
VVQAAVVVDAAAREAAASCYVASELALNQVEVVAGAVADDRLIAAASCELPRLAGHRDTRLWRARDRAVFVAERKALIGA